MAKRQKITLGNEDDSEGETPIKKICDELDATIRRIVVSGHIASKKPDNSDIEVHSIEYTTLPKMCSSITEASYAELSNYYTQFGRVSYVVVEISPVTKITSDALKTIRQTFRDKVIDIAVDMRDGTVTIILVVGSSNITRTLILYTPVERFAAVPPSKWSCKEILENPNLVDSIDTATRMICNSRETMPLLTMELSETSKYGARVFYSRLEKVDYSFLNKLETDIAKIHHIRIDYSLYWNSESDHGMVLHFSSSSSLSSTTAAAAASTSTTKKRK